jgi:hypothetical protein
MFAGSQISDYFNIEYVPLPDCDFEEKFIEKVELLSTRF